MCHETPISSSPSFGKIFLCRRPPKTDSSRSPRVASAWPAPYPPSTFRGVPLATEAQSKHGSGSHDVGDHVSWGATWRQSHGAGLKPEEKSAGPCDKSLFPPDKDGPGMGWAFCVVVCGGDVMDVCAVSFMGP